jgi:hypothetical protein
MARSLQHPEDSLLISCLCQMLPRRASRRISAGRLRTCSALGATPPLCGRLGAARDHDVEQCAGAIRKQVAAR